MLASLKKYAFFTHDELVEMTFFDIGKYVEFYTSSEKEKTVEYIKLFCIYNAESVAVGNSIVSDKHGASKLQKYVQENLNRKFDTDKEEDEPDLDHIENQFKDMI